MKKSERYQIAMIAVVTNNNINAADKLEIIETLMDNKSVAEWNESKEEQNG